MAKKKRTQAAAGIAAAGGGRKKRKAAEASSAKIKKIADDEDQRVDEESDVEEAVELPIAARPAVQRATENVEDMPLVAPGLRLWEGFADAFAGTDLVSLAKYDDEASVNAKALDVQRRYGTALKPLVVTEGPLAGRRILVLEPLTGFRFLDLPPEIRNIIYGHLFDTSIEIGIRSYKPNGQPRRPVRQGFYPGTYGSHPGLTWDKATGRWLGRKWSSHALLSVCKQVLGECAPLTYGTNTFAPLSFSDGCVWLESVGSMRRYIREFKIPTGMHYYSKVYSTFQMLQDATDLRSLIVSHTMSCPTHTVWRGKIAPTSLASYTRPLFEHFRKTTAVRGAGSECNVLDILKLDKGYDGDPLCYNCKRDRQEDCFGFSKCHTTCADSAEHLAELQDKIRSAAAKALEMEE